MAQLNSTDFKIQTATLFPTNGAGAISALDLRTQMDNIADSIGFTITGKTTGPLATDDGSNTAGNGTFQVGDIWIDETNDLAYICVDNTTSAAVWVDMTQATGGVGSVPVQDDGVPIVVSPTAHNFTGAGVTVTNVAGVATISIPGSTGSALEIEDEGISLSTAVTKINFAGTGVTATEPVANEILVTIPAAPVDSVNSLTGAVVLDPDDLNDAATTNKFTTAGDISKLAGIAAGATVGVATQDEGISVDTDATTINFVGAGVTATDAGAGVTTVTIPGSAGATIITQDEGIQVDAAATTLNFTGTGVTATDAGAGVTTVNVAPQVVTSDFSNNWAVPFRGATAYLTADDTAVDISGTLIYDWDTVENDTDSFWSAGSPSRLTIAPGSGITKVRLAGLINASTMGATRSGFVVVYKNGVTAYRGLGVYSATTGFTNWIGNVNTGVIDVVEGDYFEIGIQVASETSETILSATSYFQIEVVEVANATSRIFDIPVFMRGVPDANGLYGQQVILRQTTVPAGGGSSQAYARVAGTLSKDFTLTKNGVSFGTVTFGIGANTGTFSIASDTVFAAGDVFGVVAPSPQDATLADVSITVDGNVF